VDCTGHAALLIGGCCEVPLIDRGGELFNDTALAVQVPVAPDSMVASQTTATAHAAGWTWDIGLSARRGIGCVYSSAHMTDVEAEDTLRAYLRPTAPSTGVGDIAPRRLRFRSGHRERFWERNVLAIGQSAGFLEPLEASAIVMIELALETLARNFPRTRAAMDVQAKRFNALFRYRWDRIVEFLKLHYLLSRRDEPYWRDHRDAATVPDRLAELLEVWKHQPPSQFDFMASNEVFPAASYQYVLYGMGFPPPPAGVMTPSDLPAAEQGLKQAAQRARALAAALPSNRAYLDALRASMSPIPSKEMNG